MTLLPGSRLGPYEVVASVGAGGMGEVYKARDTRLDRIVAVKVLHPKAAPDAQLRASDSSAKPGSFPVSIILISVRCTTSAGSAASTF